MKNVIKKGLVILAVSSFTAGCGSAPSKEKVTECLKPIMPANYSVSSIEKFKALDGLYEVVVLIDNQPTVLYLDSKLKHVVSGSVVEIASKKNLTYETQMKNKPASPAVPAAPAPQGKSK